MYLAYTVAIDVPGAGGHRTLAKLLGSSLVRTYFSGDFVIFRNTPEPIFQVERQGIREIQVEVGSTHELGRATEQAWGMKYRVRDHVQELIEEGGYEKVLFLDTDCLALKNIDYLLEGDWDIRYYVERTRPIQDTVFRCYLTDDELGGLRRDGINSGTLAVSSELYHEVMEEWERIDVSDPPLPREFSEQAAWNRLILDCRGRSARAEAGYPWRAQRFERDAIQLPLFLHPHYNDYSQASLVHCLGTDISQKIKFMFGLYMTTFYCDEKATLFHLLEM